MRQLSHLLTTLACMCVVLSTTTDVPGMSVAAVVLAGLAILTAAAHYRQVRR